MNETLQKFEQKLAALQRGELSTIGFFNELTPAMFTLRGLARPLLDEYYIWAKERGDTALQDAAFACIMLAQSALLEDRVEDGLRFCAEAHRRFSDINHEDGMMIALDLEGAFYRSLGNIDLALSNTYKSYKQLKESGKYPFFYSASCFQLAELYFETKEYERAIAIYQECILASEKYGYSGFESLALNGIATAYHRLDRDVEAEKTFEQALALSKEIYSGHIQLTRTLSDFGTFWIDRGDYDKAIDYHTRSMNLRIEHKIPVGAITNMIQIGKVYLLQGSRDEALKIWLQALRSATNINSKPKLSQIYYLLYEFYEKEGNIATAFEHYKAYHKVQEELTIEEGEKKVKRAEILFAAEQTAKENAIIKAQKAEIERKNQELQETIDELTITKVSRRAKIVTIVVAVVMILAEEPIMRLADHLLHVEENPYLVLMAKVVIILSLKPIDSAIEHYMLGRIILKKKHYIRHQL